jgi:hypothetical protein
MSNKVKITMKSEAELRPLLEIDPNELVDECIVQPKLFLHYAAQQRKAEDDMNDAKAKLKKVDAKLSMKIRKNPEKYGVERLTDKAVNEALIQRPLYIKTLEAYHEAMSIYNMIGVAISCLYQRKDMLEHLVKLHGQSYYSVPYTPGDVSKLVDETLRAKAFKPKKLKKKKNFLKDD